MTKEEVTITDFNMYKKEPFYEGVTVKVKKFRFIDGGIYRCEIVASTTTQGSITPQEIEETVLRGSEDKIKQEASQVLSPKYLPYFYRAFNKAIDQLETT